MEYDSTHLTFLDDPLTYRAGTDEICVRVPANLSSEEELVSALREVLGFPDYCAISWWNTLEEVLRDWSDWKTAPRRVVLLHQDLPLLAASRDGWFRLQGYLEILLRSIAFHQEKQVGGVAAAGPRELVAIFPTRQADELRTVLTHPPAWIVSLGFLAYDVQRTFDPDWSVVLQAARHLDGLTAEVCTLSREDVGYVTLYYQRGTGTYALDYRSSDNEIWMQAATEKKVASLPFAQAIQVLESFFASGERSEAVTWLEVLPKDQFELEAQRERSYYRDSEEVLLETDIETTRVAIADGVNEAVQSGAKAFELDYWKRVLGQPDVSLVQRVAALCLIGLSNLPEAPALLQPFLRSEVKQERWVSARFAGQWGEEEALPVLLSMLTDELPTVAQAANEYWYEGWRWYVPRLLRRWQTTEVGAQLRSALVTWLQAESQFDQEIETWRRSEERICYELGYRGDFAAITDLPLAGEQRKELVKQMERGYKVKRQQMSDEEEYRYLRYGSEPKR